MWNEPMPTWRMARKEHQCQGEGCAKIIKPGELYLDRTLRNPTNSHLRYCRDCAEPITARAKSYHAFNGRSDFPDRYQRRISGAEWKSLKLSVIEQRGRLCERCKEESSSLELHHVHYATLGFEKAEDVELLCKTCHAMADEMRQGKTKPKSSVSEDVLIVGKDGDRWGPLDPNTIYIPLPDGRHVPVTPKKK
jgi:hypothetical protein